MNTAAVRFSNVYGPRQDPHGEAGVVAIFCQRIIDGRPHTVFGDGSQTRDYVHVSDVAAATYAAATKSLPEPKRLDDRAFNVATGIPTSVLELAEVLRKAAGSTTPIEFAPKRPGEQQQSFLTVEKAKSDLGWSAKISLEDGLADTFRWFSANTRTH
jgi:UDP-glucose 4-epimerase